MRRNIFRIVVLFPFLLINWAALHDISSGEPNVYLEYSVVVLSIILIVYLVTNRYIKLKQNRI